MSLSKTLFPFLSPLTSSLCSSTSQMTKIAVVDITINLQTQVVSPGQDELTGPQAMATWSENHKPVILTPETMIKD